MRSHLLHESRLTCGGKNLPQRNVPQHLGLCQWLAPCEERAASAGLQQRTDFVWQIEPAPLPVCLGDVAAVDSSVHAIDPQCLWPLPRKASWQTLTPCITVCDRMLHSCSTVEPEMRDSPWGWGQRGRTAGLSELREQLARRRCRPVQA